VALRAELSGERESELLSAAQRQRSVRRAAVSHARCVPRSVQSDERGHRSRVTRAHVRTTGGRGEEGRCDW
jgi:hypothetical protein